MTWEQLPEDGVVEIVLYYDKRAESKLPIRRIMNLGNYYFKQDEIYGYSDDPRRDIESRYPDASIKRGKWVADSEYQRIIREAFMSRFPP